MKRDMLDLIERMSRPIEKFRSIRSWDELRTRGTQTVTAFGEKFGLNGQVPTDDEFLRLLNSTDATFKNATDESIWLEFFKNSDRHFFGSFRDIKSSIELFLSAFPASAQHFVERAERLIHGRIDLLGYSDLHIGTDIDWHREPLSGTRSPMKHWKEFDDLDAAESGDKKIIWELNRHQHFFTLGVAYQITGDERFAGCYVRQLESWMEQNPPGIGINWASSLEVSFRAISWIWSFHLFRGSASLSVNVFKRAVKFLYLHGRHIERYLSKYYSPNTHLTGEALALYYLGTQLPFIKRSDHWRKLGEQIMCDEIKRQVLDDGVYFEQSTWYQRYTVDFYLQFLILRSLNRDRQIGRTAVSLESRLESALEFITGMLESRLISALEFMMHTTFPDRGSPIIGDDDGGRALPLTSADSSDFRGTLGLGASILARGDMKYVSGESTEEIFWLTGAVGLDKFRAIRTHEPAQTSRAFHNGGYYTMRDGWLDSDNFLVVDCGPVGALSGGHGHADALSIEVAIQGKKLLVDPGTRSYHHSRESREHFRSTAAHNTLAIDGVSSSESKSTFSWKNRAECTTKVWISDDRFDFFEGSHNGYERLESGVTHERSILFLKNDYIVIRDRAVTNGDHEYSLNFQFPEEQVVWVDQDSHTIGSDNWRMFVFGDGGHLRKSDGLVSDLYGRINEATRVRYLLAGRGLQELFTFIVPVDGGVSAPMVRNVTIDGARAFDISYRGYSDLLLYKNNDPDAIRTEAYSSDFKLNWSRSGSIPGRAEEYILVNGGRFNVRGTTIVDEKNVSDFAVMRQVGRDLQIRTDRGIKKVFVP